MNRNAKGLIFYLVGILMIILLVATFRDRLEASQTWNYRQFAEALEEEEVVKVAVTQNKDCLLYTSPSPRDRQKSRMPSSA